MTLDEFPTLPPQDLDAERGVLGAIVLDDKAIRSAAERLTPAMFYRTAHQEIFTAMLALHDRREPIDTVTLAAELTGTNRLERAGGISALAELCTVVATSAAVASHVRLVHEAAIRREVIRAGHELVTRARDLTRSVQDVLETTERRMFDLLKDRATKPPATIGEVLIDTLAVIDRLSKRRDRLTGISSGLTALDRMTGGWQDSDLIIVAGRPSMGKTALALGFADAAAQAGVPVGLLSLEMSRVQLGFRILAKAAHLDVSSLRNGQLQDGDWAKLAMASTSLEREPMTIDDTAYVSLPQLRSVARRLVMDRKIGLLLVDYLQLMQGPAKSESRQQVIAEISRGLKLLAKELNIPVIALSQLSRECERRDNKRPMLADLRESGAIEQDADVVLFVYRDEVYDPDSEDRGIAEVIIGKHRNGPIGTVRTAFLDRYASFENLDEWRTPA